MRLGREQASGYIEDTAADEIAVPELINGGEELTTQAPATEPAITVG
jgi:hypothetical protein